MVTLSAMLSSPCRRNFSTAVGGGNTCRSPRYDGSAPHPQRLALVSACDYWRICAAAGFGLGRGGGVSLELGRRACCQRGGRHRRPGRAAAALPSWACRRLAAAGLRLAGLALGESSGFAGLCASGFAASCSPGLAAAVFRLALLLHRLGRNLRLELGDLIRRAGRTGIDDDRRHRPLVQQQVIRRWARAAPTGWRRISDRVVGAVAGTLLTLSRSASGSSSSVAGRWRCRPHISSVRSGGAASIGVSVSSVPSEGVSHANGP